MPSPTPRPPPRRWLRAHRLERRTRRLHEPYHLTDVSRVITREELRTGDAPLAWGKHVRLFEYWTDATHTAYVAYDFGTTPVKHQQYTWGAPGEYEYVPIRYTPDL